MVRLLETLPYLRKVLSESDKQKILPDDEVFNFRESISYDILVADCEKYVHNISLQSNRIVCETQLFIFP